MSTLLSPTPLGRITLRASTPASSLPRTQVRHATMIKRPKRPYTFTQLVTLSDGSSYLHRTTSPKAIYVSLKDQRNHALWNPSNERLHNVEVDEAGRLKAFRDKFGRGWDAQADSGKEAEEGSEAAGPVDSLTDLLEESSKQHPVPKMTMVQKRR